MATNNPITGWAQDLTKKFGIGSYTGADGTVVGHGDLPPEVQQQVDQIAKDRDLFRAGSGDDAAAPYQEQINGLYNPATRQNTMEQIQRHRMMQELNSRLSARDKY